MRRIALAGAAFTGAAGVGGMTWAVRGRTSSIFGPSVYRGVAGRKALAITFDDGPGAATAKILNILAEYRAPATFFQCGVNVSRQPDMSRAVSRAGHEIGNHSWSHPNCALRRPSFIQAEFSRSQSVIAEAAGKAPSLMRAPFGVRWFGFREMQKSLGLLNVMWTVLGRDWKLPSPAIAKRVLSRVEDGAIICLHDGRGIQEDPDAGPTIEAVRRILPALLETGYHFETVSQLLCQMTN